MDLLRSRLRELVMVLGIGTIAFGIGPVLAPRWFGRMFAIPVDTDPRLLVMVRSVGVRDALIGLGLLRAAARREDYGPWLLARVGCDLGDTLAVAIAIRSGSRQPKFVALGVIALLATLVGLALSRVRAR